LLVDGGKRAGQAGNFRSGVKAMAQGGDRREIQVFGAPLQHFDIVEFVRLYPPNEFVVERIDLAGDPEGAVLQVSAGAAGDLAELTGIEIAELIAVELAVLRKGDMVDVEVEAHADSIGCNKIFDVAFLIERHLRIAGPRAEGPQNNGR